MSDSKNTYAALLVDRGFQSFLWTQFLGAFNDNVYKIIVSILAVEMAASNDLGSRYLALAGAVFVLPFLLFSGWAGQLADRFSKTRVLVVTKAFEMLFMVLATGALISQRLEYLLVVLFLLAAQAAFFSPAKYGILPEMMPAAAITRANGLLELSTFVAIVVGTSFGTILFEHWKQQPVYVGSVMLGIAVLGSTASLGIRRVPASGSRQSISANPMAEVLAGVKRLAGDRPMRLTVAGISYFWFVGGLLQMSILLLGKETLHISETEIGLLVTALAIGIGIGSIVAGRISGDQVDLGLVPAGSALMAVFSIALGFTHSYETALVLLALLGFAGGLFIVPLNAFLQERAGREEKGRLLATNNFVNMSGVISASGVLWLLHDLCGLRPGAILIAAGLMTVIATFYMIRLLSAQSLRLVVLAAARILFRVRVTGAERLPREGAALIAANHVSFADAVLIGTCTPRLIRFLMLRSIYSLPALNWICRLFEAIPLAPRSARDTVEALRAARKQLEAGELVGIFPEGALTPSGHLQPFKSGMERIISGTGVPVIPVWLEGLWGHPLSLKGGKPFSNWTKGLRREVTIHIGEPVYGEPSAEDVHARVAELGAVAAVSDTARTTLAREFVLMARRSWSSIAVADSTGKELTFGRTLSVTLLLAGWLRRERRGEERIGLLLPSSVGGALANLGVTFAGRTAVNLNFTAGDAIDSAIRQCGMRTILTSKLFIGKAGVAELPGMVYLEELLPSFSGVRRLWCLVQARWAPARWLTRQARDPRAAAAIIFSSGTSGEPKGIELSHTNVLANVRSVAQVYTVDHRDALIGVLPFFHSFGYTFTLWFPLLNGFRAAYHANPTDAWSIGELAARHRATLLLSTPTFCAGYLRKCTREQFGTLRYVLVGAEKLREPLASAFREKFGVPLLEGYGCTEMSPVVAVNCPGTARPGSVGKPVPGVSVRIVDPESHEPLPAGSEGLLLVNGPSRMKGYLGRPAGTALRGGYFVTGDIARMDRDGYLYITDRLARFSKIGGEMVPHGRIEEALSKVLEGAPCVVVSVPDESRGERLAALYVKPEMAPAAVWSALSSDGLPPLWVPKRDSLVAVDAIPQLGTGKTDLRRAREIAAQRLVRG